MRWPDVVFHGVNQLDDAEHFAIIERVLSKLDRHFFVAHVHANNGGGWINCGNVVLPRLLEVTFASWAFFTPNDDATFYPTELDRACLPQKPEIILGAFRY